MPERGIKHTQRLNELSTDEAGVLWYCLSPAWARATGEQRGFWGGCVESG